MLRKLALSLAIAGALGAANANALGLGEIRVKSALNEPLNAEIKLLQVRDLSPMQIKPRMADVNQFSLAGINKSRFLSNVKFQVKVRPDGTGYIEMHSSTPVKEPFLNFLVEVNWPSGRLVREYTVLLDPPVFDANPVAGAVQPAAQPAKSMPAPTPTTVESKAAVAPSSPSPKNVSNIRTRMNPKTEIYVDIHDTLWVLAKNNRPSSNVSVEQMMLALQRKNPASFPTDNINFLKAGTVMTLPTLDEIRKLSRKQAVAEVVRQTEAWKKGRSKPKTASKAAVDGGKASAGKSHEPAPAAPGASDSTLKIVTPEQGTVSDKKAQMATDNGMAPAATPNTASSAQSGMQDKAASAAQPSAGTQALLKRNAELEDRLLATQETVDKVQRENQDLNSKVDSIASQMDKLQRLIDLKEQQLALMQKQLMQQQEKPKSGLLDTLLQTPVYLAGLGAALIGLLVGLLVAGRRRKKGDEESQLAVAAPVAAAATAVAASAADSDTIPDMGKDVEAAAVVAEEPQQAADAEPEHTLAEPDVAAEVTEEDLADLDLDMDMDLDLDETAAAATNEQVAPIDSEEFDLGVDDLEPVEAVAEPEADDLDSALDDILGADESPTLADSESAADVDSALDDLLAESDELPEEPSVAMDELTEPEPEASDASELDFALDQVAGTEDAGEAAADAEDDVLDLPEDLEFAVQTPVADDVAEEAPAAGEEDELAGLAFDVELPEGHADGAENGDEMLDDFFAEEKVDTEDGFAPIADTEDVEPLTDEPIEVDTGESRTNIETLDAEPEADEFDIDADLEAMLKDSAAAMDEEELEEPKEVVTGETGDLDALLAAFDADEDESDLRSPTQGERVEEELTANIAHDLDGDDLDSEIDDLLGSTDDEIALDEETAEEVDDFDNMQLLDGADEIETKLDLARAYIEMDDTDGARDILNEILKEGSDTQRQEAQKLIQSLS